MHGARQARCVFPQFPGKKNLFPSPAPPVKQGTLPDVPLEHFFQAYGLRAQLNAILVGRLASPTFVLYGKGTPYLAFPVKFHHIRPAAHSQHRGTQQESGDDFQIAAHFHPAAVRPFMQKSALSRSPVFRSCHLHVDQRALPRAIGVMLQGGKLDKIVFRV
jgi:hypothetical protein